MTRAAPLVESRLAEGGAALANRAHEHGYLFFRDLLPLHDVLEVRHLVLDVAGDLGWLDPTARHAAGIAVPDLRMGAYDDPRWIEMLQIVLPHPSFRELGKADAIAEAARAVLAGEPRSESGDLVRVVSSDDPKHTTLPHQDRFYIRGEASLATVWLPLGECPIELGPLAILPGSHRDGILPHHGEGMGKQGCRVPADAIWHASDLECGDVIVFSGMTVHRALPNRGRRKLRISADYRFRSAAPIRTTPDAHGPARRGSSSS